MICICKVKYYILLFRTMYKRFVYNILRVMTWIDDWYSNDWLIELKSVFMDWLSNCMDAENVQAGDA
jgi:hypothetical protein